MWAVYYFIGVAVGGFAFYINTPETDMSLNECEKLNNVYECEYIATPKGEK